MDEICRFIVLSLHDLFSESHETDGGHGVEHALKVYRHAENTLAIDRSIKDPLHIQAIKCACLLHDADDSKFFDSKDYDNARMILFRAAPEKKDLRDLTIELIKLVSCTSNGNSTDNINKGEEWKLIPRLCDRLEAIGSTGILRAWYYSKHINRPLSLPSTPRARTEEDIWKIATPERFSNYLKTKSSVSMIDHFYDKVLHIGDEKIMGVFKNPYILSTARQRQKIIIDFILEYGKKGYVDIRRINKLRYTSKE